MTSEEKYLDLLEAEISLATEYHNHKETMAWVATSFYVSGIIVLGYNDKNLIADNSFPRFVAIALIVILAILTLFFVSFQFSKRKKAADEIEGLRIAISEFLQSKSPLTDEDKVIKKPNHYPKFVQDKIDQAITESQGRSLADWFRTDFVSYIVIVIFTILSLYLTTR